MIEISKKFVDITGERIAYIEEGKGDTVVLLHGNMSSSVFFAPLIERLAPHYRVIAPDFRGMGDSTFNNPFEEFSELANDIKEFLERVKVDSAHFIAWSAGACVTMELAAGSDMVKSIFLIEGASCKGYPVFPRNPDGSYVFVPYKQKSDLLGDAVIAPCIAALDRQDREAVAKMWELIVFNAPKHSEQERNIYIDEMLKQRNLIDIDWALAIFNMSDTPNAYRQGNGEVGKIKCPVALTTGTMDYVVPYSMVEENLKAMPHAKLIKYDGCAHAPCFHCIDQLTQDILEFLGKV